MRAFSVIAGQQRLLRPLLLAEEPVIDRALRLVPLRDVVLIRPEAVGADDPLVAAGHPRGQHDAHRRRGGHGHGTVAGGGISRDSGQGSSFRFVESVGPGMVGGGWAIGACAAANPYRGRGGSPDPTAP